MSQAELGGERYSGSYISHLESGRRSPTAEVREFLAERLGVDADTLSGTDSRREDMGGLQRAAVLELNARTAWEHGDYRETAEIAEQARRAAVEHGRPESWWAITHLMAQALLVLEDYDRCHELAVELVRHPFADDAPELRVEARVLASKAFRASGRLDEALAYSTEAVDCATELPASSWHRVQALLTQLSALGELGLRDDAEPVAAQLREARKQLPVAHLQGLVAWSLGNLAFLDGSIAEGVSEHDAAARALNPDSDLRAWGRFCKASVAMRLAAGSTDGVEALLAQATHAITLVGNDGDRRELSLVRGELLLAQGRPDDALIAVEETATADAPLPPHTRAEAEWLRQRCLRARGDLEQAREAAAAAAVLFEQAGAYQRALTAWRTHAGREDAGSSRTG